MSRRYAISSVAEARAYLAHPVLGPRLIECAQIVAELHGLTAQEIFGGIDAVKLRSSMTLFDLADPAKEVFRRVLDVHFAGIGDDATERLLGSTGSPLSHRSDLAGLRLRHDAPEGDDG